MVVCLFSPLTFGCARIEGIWETSYSGAIAGSGFITFSHIDDQTSSVILDLSQADQQRIIQGTASCRRGKLVIHVGGLSEPVSNLKLIGGTLVGMLEPFPFDTPFGAWEIHVVKLDDFSDLKLKGFWRMTRMGQEVPGHSSTRDGTSGNEISGR